MRLARVTGIGRANRQVETDERHGRGRSQHCASDHSWPRGLIIHANRQEEGLRATVALPP